MGHQWADLSEQGYGVSLLNDCKYGYDIKDNRLRLSLVKSATHPDYAADQGEHIFTYALLPHQGSWIEGGTVFEAWDLNSPLTWAKGAPQRDRFSLFALDVDNVMIDVVKKAEDEDKLVVRLHGVHRSQEQGHPVHGFVRSLLAGVQPAGGAHGR